jgi:hypothetical protein
MDAREKILEFLKVKGPSVPTALGKVIERDSLYASAYLSEMKDAGKIKISSIKLGGSPLYYIPGQEELLQNFAENLGEKDKKMYEILKEKKVVKDTELVPVFRLAVRQIKDFAFPLNVTFDGKKELFWKWSLLPNEDAEKIINSMITREKTPILETLSLQKESKQEFKRETKPPTKSENTLIQERLLEKNEPEVKTPDKEKPLQKIGGEFFEEASSFFEKNKIKIIETTIIKRKTEIDFIIEMPSPVGNLKYYCKAKSKKKISDGDLSSAFVIGQSKRLPVLFLSKGDLVKRAALMLENEFKGMKFTKL